MAADSIEWMLQGILTSVLSGVGFYIITRALEYAKKYCHLDRQRPMFVYNCLSDAGNPQGMSIHRRHLLNDNICSRATALFAAYKRSSAFLCHTSPAEYDSDSSATDNALYGAPQWSNIHREPLPDFSLTHSLYNLSWVASDDLVTPCSTSLSGIRLWSRSNHDVEDSWLENNSANQASGMCGDYGAAVGGKDPLENTDPGSDHCLQEGKAIGRRMKCTNVRGGKKRGAIVKKHPENGTRMRYRDRTKPMKVTDWPSTASTQTCSQKDYNPLFHQADEAGLIARNGASREQGDHILYAVPAQKVVSPNDMCQGLPEGSEFPRWSNVLDLSQFMQPVCGLPTEDHLQTEWTKDTGFTQALLAPPLQSNMKNAHRSNRSNNDSMRPKYDTKAQCNEKFSNADERQIKKWENKERQLMLMSKPVKKSSNPLSFSPKPDSKYPCTPICVTRGRNADASPDSKNDFRLSVSEKSISPTVNKSICSSVSPRYTRSRPKRADVSTKPAGAIKQSASPSPQSQYEEPPSGSLKVNRWNLFKKPSVNVINDNVVKRATPMGKEQVNGKRGEHLSSASNAATTPSPRKPARPAWSIPCTSSNVSPQPSPCDASAGPLARFRAKSPTPTDVLKSNATSRCVKAVKGRAELAVESAEKMSPFESGIHNTAVRFSPRGNSRRSLYSLVNKSESYFKVLKRKMTIQRKTVVTIRHQEAPQVQPPQVFRQLKQRSDESRHQQETRGAGDRMQSMGAACAIVGEDSIGPRFEVIKKDNPRLDVVPVTSLSRRSPKAQRSPNAHIEMSKHSRTSNVDSTKSISLKKPQLDSAERKKAISDSRLQISKAVSSNTTVKTTNIKKKQDRLLKDHAKKLESRQENKNLPFLPLRDYSVTVCNSRVLDTYGPLMTYHPKSSESKAPKRSKHHREGSSHRHPVIRECSPPASLGKDSVNQTLCCSIESVPSEMISLALPWDEKTPRKTAGRDTQGMHRVQTPPASDESPHEARGMKMTSRAGRRRGGVPSYWRAGEVVSAVRYRSEKQFHMSGSETTFSALYQSGQRSSHGGQICGAEGNVLSPEGQICKADGEMLSRERQLRENGPKIVSHESLISETWGKELSPEEQLSEDEGDEAISHERQTRKSVGEMLSIDMQLSVDDDDKVISHKRQTRKSVGKMLSIDMQLSVDDGGKVISHERQTRKSVGKILSLEGQLHDADSQISQHWSEENVTHSSGTKKTVSPTTKLKKKRSTVQPIKKKSKEPSLNKKSSSPPKKHSKSPAKSSTAKQLPKLKNIQGGSSLSRIPAKKSPLKVAGDTRKLNPSPAKTKTKKKIFSPQIKAPSKSIFAKRVSPAPRKTDKPSAVTVVKSQKHIVKRRVSPGKVNAKESHQKNSKAPARSVSEPASRQTGANAKRPAERVKAPMRTTAKPKAMVERRSQASTERKKTSESSRGNEKINPANKRKQLQWRESASLPQSKHESPASSPKHVTAALLVERSPPRARRSPSLPTNECSMEDMYCGRDYAEKVSTAQAQRHPPVKDRVVNLRKSTLDDVVKKIQSSR